MEALSLKTTTFEYLRILLHDGYGCARLLKSVVAVGKSLQELLVRSLVAGSEVGHVYASQFVALQCFGLSKLLCELLAFIRSNRSKCLDTLDFDGHCIAVLCLLLQQVELLCDQIRLGFLVGLLPVFLQPLRKHNVFQLRGVGVL